MKRLIVAAALAMAVAACSQGRMSEKEDAGEVKVKLEECPPAVQETIRHESAGGKIEGISKEGEADKVVYEADIEVAGKDYELKISNDGKLIKKKLEADENEKGEHGMK